MNNEVQIIITPPIQSLDVSISDFLEKYYEWFNNDNTIYNHSLPDGFVELIELNSKSLYFCVEYNDYMTDEAYRFRCTLYPNYFSIGYKDYQYCTTNYSVEEEFQYNLLYPDLDYTIAVLLTKIMDFYKDKYNAT